MKLLQSLPPKRLFVYAILLLFIPFFLLYFHFNNQLKSIENVSVNLETTAFSFLEKERKQAVNKACRHFFTKAPLALEKEMETLTFLKKEIEEIERLLKKETFFGSPQLEKRLSFLTEKENRLSFIETSTQVKFGVQETIVAIARPVEIDTVDLKKILSLLEGSYPQYLILDFQLNRTAKENGSEAFLLNFKLSRREFL